MSIFDRELELSVNRDHVQHGEVDVSENISAYFEKEFELSIKREKFENGDNGAFGIPFSFPYRELKSGNTHEQKNGNKHKGKLQPNHKKKFMPLGEKAENSKKTITITSIPKVIIRFEGSTPAIEREIKNSIEIHAPEWEEVVIDPSTIREHISQFQINWRLQFDTLSKKDQCEVGKYLFLYERGGIYIGRDYLLGKNMDNLFYEESNLYLFKSSMSSFVYTYEFMASKQRQDFWISMVMSYLKHENEYSGPSLISGSFGKKDMYRFNNVLSKSKVSHFVLPASVFCTNEPLGFNMENEIEMSGYFIPASNTSSSFFDQLGIYGIDWWWWLLLGAIVLLFLVILVTKWLSSTTPQGLSYNNQRPNNSENWTEILKDLNIRINDMNKNFMTSKYNYGLKYKN